jgi:hypothetical protein
MDTLSRRVGDRLVERRVEMVDSQLEFMFGRGTLPALQEMVADGDKFL